MIVEVREPTDRSEQLAFGKSWEEGERTMKQRLLNLQQIALETSVVDNEIFQYAPGGIVGDARIII